ncbi:MAG TPA: hypothetical protein VMS43_05625 [Allosphingosinicella sp.]|nr:hypothetical protein [Allosphingosinicella sp.]
MGSDHDIKVLNSLITTTIDSALGFERSAEDAKAGNFAAMFRDFCRPAPRRRRRAPTDRPRAWRGGR